MADEKTIKQLADEIGVTKQAIWQKIKRQSSTDLHQLMIKKGNTVYVQPKGQAFIKAMFDEKSNADRKQVDDKENVNVDNKVDEIEFLRNLVNDLQTEKKELYKLLDQQQILTLQANKKIEELELNNTESESQKEENEFSFSEEREESSVGKKMEETIGKKNFWTRWFKK